MSADSTASMAPHLLTLKLNQVVRQDIRNRLTAMSDTQLRPKELKKPPQSSPKIGVRPITMQMFQPKLLKLLTEIKAYWIRPVKYQTKTRSQSILRERVTFV